jgi:hypothetical protein
MMATLHGHYARFDYGDLELTEELEEALGYLDENCRYGFGGSFDIFESDSPGADWEAVPTDGPYDTLYFVDGKWTETVPEPVDDDDDFSPEDPV